jgi:hypothetical protein
MLFEAAGEPQPGTDFNPSHAAHDGDTPARITVGKGVDERNDITAGFIDKKDLLKRAFQSFDCRS